MDIDSNNKNWFGINKERVLSDLSKPILYDLMKNIVRYKVKENLEKMKGGK